MRLSIATRHAVKRGNSDDEYEDACCPASTPEWKGSRFRGAVADGATEASFSALWARLLVGGWCNGMVGWRQPWRRLSLLQRDWQVQTALQSLPWYAEEKARAGAFSSLLGISLSASKSDGRCRWHALAVGDSCVFHLRRGTLLAAFPFSRSAQFGSRPFLLSSRSADERDISAVTRRYAGRFARGDTFLLMTDALAAWYLRSLESGTDAQSVLDQSGAGDPASFDRMVENLRNARELRNDDVTLLTVHVQ